MRKNQLSFQASPPTARETADTAQLMRQKSLVMGIGNVSRQQGIEVGW